jgi:hypothetical protein
MLTKRVRRALGALALAPLLITACDGNNPFDPFDDALGVYDLTIFATRSMPATFVCNPGQCPEIPNGGTIRVNNGTLTLDDDGTYVERNNFTFSETGFPARNEPFVSIGTFSINGDNVTLDDDNGTRFVSGSIDYLPDEVRISYQEGGDLYEYVKR